MSYQTIMVHLHIGHSNADLLHITRSLAERFQAEVLGIMVGQPTQMIYGKGYAALDFFDKEQAHIEQKIAESEAQFREVFKGFSKKTEWRSTITREPMAGYIAAQACSADIIVTGVSPSDFYEGPNAVNASEIVMQAGRPVIVVPNAVKSLKLENILIGWKDTREARRAIADALPIFKLATQVTVVNICDESEVRLAEQHLAEVIAWLVRHGIASKSVVSVSVDTDATQLIAIAKQQSADLVVAGAYGHSRLRQWVLGGVTNDLLQHADFCSLLSH
jgi:nucleotide-binding universal stress UspA family protein